MLERLQSGDIDAGILALPVHGEGLVQQSLFDEPFVVALPSDHRLAKRSSLKVQDLDDETLLLLEDGHCLRDQALAVCSHGASHEKQDFRATSLETLRQMVASGSGITLLPELASRGAYAAASGVAIVRFARPAPVRNVGAIWRKTSARGPVLEAVCNVIRDAVGRLARAA
jgi:LysR family hydrogen peroxide-inducible transcriptional activator